MRVVTKSRIQAGYSSLSAAPSYRLYPRPCSTLSRGFVCQKASFVNQGAGVFSPLGVYPSRGAKLVVADGLEDTFSTHGGGTFIFLVSLLLWLVHVVRFCVELFQHRYVPPVASVYCLWSRVLSRAACGVLRAYRDEYLGEIQMLGGYRECCKAGKQCTSNSIEMSYWEQLFHQPHVFASDDKPQNKKSEKSQKPKKDKMKKQVSRVYESAHLDCRRTHSKEIPCRPLLNLVGVLPCR